MAANVQRVWGRGCNAWEGILYAFGSQNGFRALNPKPKTLNRLKRSNSIGSVHHVIHVVVSRTDNALRRETFSIEDPPTSACIDIRISLKTLSPKLQDNPENSSPEPYKIEGKT